MEAIKVNIRYDFGSREEFDESLQMAMEDYNALVEKKEYAFVRIVVSEHWASEGIWVEAFDVFKPVNSKTDTVTKFFDRDGTF